MLIMTNTSLQTPLIKPPLETWFDHHISQTREEDKLCSANTALKVSLIALVILRNICFISLNSEMPYAKYTEGVWASGNILSLSALDYWAGSRFIDDVLPKEEGLEKAFPQENTRLKSAALIASFIPAFLGQIPPVYVAMEYSSPPFKIPIGILVLLGGALIPLRSLQLSIQKRLIQHSPSQKQFLALLQENRQNFINLTPAEKTVFINALQNTRELSAYFEHMLQKGTLSEKPSLKSAEYASTECAKIIGCILAGAYQFTTGNYTFVKTKETVLEDDIFAGVMAAVVVASTLYLSGTAIIDSSVSLFHSLTGIDKNARESQESLIKKLKGKHLDRLNLVGHFSNALALGVSYVIWKDFYENETEKVFFEVTMCLAVFLLLYAATPAVIEDAVKQTLSKEEKEILAIDGRYETLINAIEKISSHSFEDVHNLLPEPLKQALKTTTPADPEISLHNLPRDIINNPLYDEESQNFYLNSHITEDEIDSKKEQN